MTIRAALLLIAALSAGACRAQTSASADAPAADGATCAASLTGTPFLSTASAPPPVPESAPVSCGPATRGPNETRLLTLTLAGGARIGFGRGGQIYSIRVPGLSGDLIPMRRPDAPFMDGVLQTIGTNTAERRASPRGAAAIRGEIDRGSSWNYHQAGAYQRGVLAGKPPTYSPLVHEKLDAARGTIETLTLAVQAHPTEVPGDRFLVYMRTRAIAPDTIELTQGWIDNSRNAFGEEPTLDYFNVPYLVLNNDLLPRVSVAGTDVSAQPWPPARGDALPQGPWVAAFAGDGDEAPGLALVTGSTGSRLRYGGRMIDAVSDETGGSVDQRIFVVSNIRNRLELAPGEAMFATSYIVLGKRADVLRRAAALAAKPVIAERPLGPGADVVALCGASMVQPCAKGQSPRFALGETLCAQCLPVYELTRGTETVYSTEPYLGALTGRYLSDPAYRIRRIVGWLPPAGSAVPAGWRFVPLDAAAPIRADEQDYRKFGYLLPR